MFLKFTKQFGKPICAALYAVFAYLAIKKNPPTAAYAPAAAWV